MTEFVKFIDGMKTEGLTPPIYLVGADKNNYNDSVIRILEILRVYKNAAAILDSNEVPLTLVNAFAGLIQEFKTTHFDGFTKTIAETPEAPNYYRTAMNNLGNYHNAFFNLTSSNNYFRLINSINNYKLQDAAQIEAKANRVIGDFAESQKTFNALTENLAKTSTKKVLSNYEDIFSKQEIKHRNASWIWLAISVGISIAFLWVFIASINKQWLSIVITLSGSRDGHEFTNEVFNIPLLISKAVIISFIIFLISFCFKQYSINKNLQVINEQRKNAIGSYVLFEASVGSDSAAKNVLLMQLAKSIYQMTQTGFLSSKHSDFSNNQLLELTRFIQGSDSKL